MAAGEMSSRYTYRRPPSSIKQEQEDDSDSESQLLGPKRLDGLESQIIHSGHFMVSSPHIEHPPKKGYDFDTVNTQTCQTYRFGNLRMSHLSIDASLTKLFECMTLAYRYVITHYHAVFTWTLSFSLCRFSSQLRGLQSRADTNVRHGTPSWEIAVTSLHFM